MSLAALRRFYPTRIRSSCYFVSGFPTSSSTTPTSTSYLLTNRFVSQSHSVEDETAASNYTDPLNETEEFYDIVIAGGGLIGTIFGVAAANSPLLLNKKILLLEASPAFSSGLPNQKVKAGSGFSNRVYAISPGSQKFLEKIQIWKDVHRFKEVSSMQVWDALSSSSIQLHNTGYYPPVSYIVESPVLSSAVENSLVQSSNVTVQFGCSLKDCSFPHPENSSDYAKAILSNGKKISASLVIGADGYNSKVRTCMSSPYIHGVYDRTAIVATLVLSEPTENNVAWQRFLPTGGPIALLPLSADHSSLVWSTFPSNAKRLLALSDDEFIVEVNSALNHEYPQNPLVSTTSEILSKLSLLTRGPGILPPAISTVVPKSRASFPLGFGHAAHYVNCRAALIGDAAHRVHPLGGLGLNLGIGDVASLVRILEQSSSMGENLGSFERLKYYETERQRHNLFIQSGLEFMHRVYGTNLSPVVIARSVGLSLFNSSDALKKCVMAQAAA